jgi:uncharacterized protein
MSRFLLKTSEHRIGVVGLSNAGKTAFLTSLIHHLVDHDDSTFPLGKNSVTLTNFRELPSSGEWPPFPFAAYRKALSQHQKWPEKSRDRAVYSCQFERSDWSFSDCRLQLHDLPGERLADAAMLGRDYAGWSDHLLALLRNDATYKSIAVAFLKAVDEPDSTEQELIHEYKKLLATLVLSFHRLISPSVFLLDQNGVAAKAETMDELANSRLVGLNADSQFVPLSTARRVRDNALSATFTTRFQQYQAKVVKPYIEALRTCHALVVLVDVMALLASGESAYDDQRQLLTDLVTVLKPGENALQSVARHVAQVVLPYQLRPAWISKLAFVAPKLDLVHPKERDHLQQLLKRFVGKLANNLVGVQHEFFSVASVVSTKLFPGSDDTHDIVGIPYRDEQGRKLQPGPEQRLRVPTIPAEWPTKWSYGQFVFPEVYPFPPTRKDAAPDQLQLDRVFNFLIG